MRKPTRQAVAGAITAYAYRAAYKTAQRRLERAGDVLQGLGATEGGQGDQIAVGGRQHLVLAALRRG